MPAGKSARIFLLVLFFGGSRGQKAGKKKRWCGQKAGKKKSIRNTGVGQRIYPPLIINLFCRDSTTVTLHQILSYFCHHRPTSPPTSPSVHCRSQYTAVRCCCPPFFLVCRSTPVAAIIDSSSPSPPPPTYPPLTSAAVDHPSSSNP